MKTFLVLSFLTLSSTSAFAVMGKNIPAQLRLFGGANATDPKDLNEEMQAQGLKTFDTVTQFGAEAGGALGPIDLGLRYMRKYAKKDEDPSADATDYYAQIDQDTMAIMLRIPIVKSDFVRLDIFGGYGGSNTTLKLETAGYSGSMTKKESGDWFASPYSLYGASIGVGYKKFYFVFEGGMESNKVKDFKRFPSTTGPAIEELDLSGSYFTIGLMFDGLEGKKR